MNKDFRNGFIEILKEHKGDDLFNGFFKELKGYVKIKTKKGIKNNRTSEILLINKRDIIIFSIGDKIKNVDIGKIKKRYIFPFDKIFIEYLFYKEIDDCFCICDGIFLEKKEKVIICTTKWTIYNPSLNSSLTRFSHLVFNADDIMDLSETPDEAKSEDGFSFGPLIYTKVKDIIQKVMYAIDKKEYTTYKKYNGSNYLTKEIIYSRDVCSHERHFWKDTGKFNIPFMSNEELKNKGYEVDELVFKDNELRRDVPYRIINTFKVGIDKPKQESNRRIHILKNRIYRNEEKLGKILKEIFPNEFIKHNKRFSKRSNLTLDWNLWNLRIAFEYDGEQHFDKELYSKLYGNGFESQVKRDREKDKLCKKKNIRLIRIKYDEPLNISHIRGRLKQ